MPTDKPSGSELRNLDEARRLMREIRIGLGLSSEAKPLPRNEPPLCSFCGTGRNNVEFMFEG